MAPEERAVDEDKKKPDGQPPPPGAPPADLGLHEINRGDATVEEENLIEAVVGRHLDHFAAALDGVVTDLEAQLVGRPVDEQAVLDQPGFHEALGSQLLGQLQAVGGEGAPLMEALVGEAAPHLAWAAQAEPTASGFLVQVRRALREACRHLRESYRSLLAERWVQLTRLAAEGSLAFVPPLLQLGLPPLDFDARAFADDLLRFADAWQRAQGLARAKVAEALMEAEEGGPHKERDQDLALEEPERKEKEAR